MVIVGAETVKKSYWLLRLITEEDWMKLIGIRDVIQQHDPFTFIPVFTVVFLGDGVLQNIGSDPNEVIVYFRLDLFIESLRAIP